MDEYLRTRPLASLQVLTHPMVEAAVVLVLEVAVAAHEAVAVRCLWSWAWWRVVVPIGQSCCHRRAHWQDQHDEGRSTPRSVRYALARSLPQFVDKIQRLVVGVQSQPARLRATWQGF
jgi:hypothetical protein